ncbi:MAG: hypothetical protein A2007_05480 [Verrucomicrobia bacterium GWC2_42_7]|nr:MAG: hypothetical protein A2007_05480 [Verrucomicrobia bacterium GWC2_42_7]
MHFSELHISLSTIAQFARVVVTAVIGFPLLIYFSKLAEKLTKGKLAPSHTVIVKKAVFYGGSLLLISTILMGIGINLSAFLGAAGVVSIALGIAMQTTISNFISGFLLLGEKSFQIGDVIQHGNMKGSVEAIGLLSIRIRTSDNLFTRIPNEQLLKMPFVNCSRFDLMRLNLEIMIPIESNLDDVMVILRGNLSQNPLIVKKPMYSVVFQGIRNYNLLFSCELWYKKEQINEIKNSLLKEITNSLSQNKIPIIAMRELKS